MVGLINNAKEATEETRASQVQEAKYLWVTEKAINRYSNSSNSMTLSELIDDLVKRHLLTEDEKDIILGNISKGIDAQYQITIGSRTIDFPRDINTLEIGAYVKYNDKIWRVLYNDDTNGVQLILSKVEEQITLGYNDPTITEEDFKYTGTYEFNSNFKKGVASFNNIMNNFTKTAQKYVKPNDNIVVGVRWYGYFPDKTPTFCNISELENLDSLIVSYQLAECFIRGSVSKYSTLDLGSDWTQYKKIFGDRRETEFWYGFPYFDVSKSSVLASGMLQYGYGGTMSGVGMFYLGDAKAGSLSTTKRFSTNYLNKSNSTII